MKRWGFVILLTVALIVAVGCQKKPQAPAYVVVELRFGALPVMQALPIFVASDRNLFDTTKVKVTVVNFNTAAEKDIAMAAGNIQGQFADLFTPVVIEANGQDVAIVATNYITAADRRMFGVLANPSGEYTTAASLADKPIALSSNTVIDYVAERLLTDRGLPADKIARLEMKNIGMRFQMLMSGQVDAAVLPEPLVTAAVAGGAILIADDSSLVESQTVLAFSQDFISAHADAVTTFLRGVQAAENFLNAQPDSARAYMIQYVRLPEQLKDTYPTPKFPALSAPDSTLMAEVTGWLKAKNAIPADVPYASIVNPSLLP